MYMYKYLHMKMHSLCNCIHKYANSHTHKHTPRETQRERDTHTHTSAHTANPRTVVVLIHGGVIAIEWTKANVSAILNAHYPVGPLLTVNLLFMMYAVVCCV